MTSSPFLVAGLTARLDELSARVADLEVGNARLVVENTELRHRLGRNSTDSSRAPSSDGLDKPPPTSMRGQWP